GFFFPMLSMMDIILPRPKPLISDVRQSGSSPAVMAMTERSALEAALHGIRINAICPALMETPISQPWMRSSGSW
ncbi:hypothetical protein AB0M41_45390, partial [Streptomyces sp. NPDC051896]